MGDDVPGGKALGGAAGREDGLLRSAATEPRAKDGGAAEGLMGLSGALGGESGAGTGKDVAHAA